MADLVVDVLVIGGGPAGLSAALVLGRARRSVIVVDAEQPRNRVVHESHGFLTRDGVSPTEFRAIARAQIAAYSSVRFERDTVTELTGENGAFTAQTRQGRTIRSRKVLFATGETSVPGVYVAGDAGREGYQLIIAASDGSIAAIAINGELLHEDWLTR